MKILKQENIKNKGAIEACIIDSNTFDFKIVESPNFNNKKVKDYKITLKWYYNKKLIPLSSPQI